MSQICHSISEKPGKDISQSGHELQSKNRGNESWKSHDRPFFNELTPHPKPWFMKFIQFHSFSVLWQMHVHPLPRVKLSMNIMKTFRNTCMSLRARQTAQPGPQGGTSETVSRLSSGFIILQDHTGQKRASPLMSYRMRNSIQKLGSIVCACCLYTGSLGSQVRGQTYAW